MQTTYAVIPSFTHVDKDLAEISALAAVWPKAKTQICLWHLQRAINDRLAKITLRTTPYDTAGARHEFGFISSSFRPIATADPKDDEEYGYKSSDDYRPNRKNKSKPKKRSLTQTIPPPLPPRLLSQVNPNALIIKIPNAGASRVPATQPPPVISPYTSDDENKNTDTDGSDAEVEGDSHGSRKFCPVDLRESVTSLVTAHFCAHPSIPGYARPSDVGIRWWAVQEMYNFCVRNNLPELWAYMWGNWYRPERWKLWARSACAEIPRLRTTMICESQYVILFSLRTADNTYHQLATHQV